VGSDLYATADGGTTWTPLPRNYQRTITSAIATPSGGASGTPVATTYEPGAFHLLGNGRAWLLVAARNPQGRELLVLQTTDNGQTWTRYHFPNAPAACERSLDTIGLISVDFVDGDHGWLIGRSAICHTADGGKNWTQAR
jgi:photosystem II stability/assembly factor-like uncharacterized protein